MTTNAITNYYTLTKSSIIDKAKQSVFNTPIANIVFISFTLITAAYCIKKINDSVRVALNRPIETLCIAGLIVSTGVVIAHYPIWTMILFVGLSFILLNKQAYTKVQEIDKHAKAFFINSPFQKMLDNVIFGDNTSSKLIENSNLTDNYVSLNDNVLPVTTAVHLLNFEELKLKTLQSNDISSNNNILPPILTEVEEVNTEDLSFDSPQLSENDVKSSDNVSPLPLGIIDHINLMSLNFKNLQTGNINSNGNSSLLGVAKTMNQFNIDGINLEKIDLSGSAQQEDELNSTDSSSVTWPIKPVKFSLPTSYPSSNGDKTWSNHKPFEKTARPIINPLGFKSGVSLNKMVKFNKNLLNLMKRIPK